MVTTKAHRIAFVLMALLLAGFVLFPFGFLAGHVSVSDFTKAFFNPENRADILWALQNSILQSLGSVCISFLLGLIFCCGIIYAREHLGKKIGQLFEALCLLPGLLPSLVTILIVLNLWNHFPLGILGISLLHGIYYGGFVSLTLLHLIEEKMLSLIEVGYILGASARQMWWQVIKSLRWELTAIGFFIFSLSFTSFSIPIAVGGSHGTTLEVLIYEKIRLANQPGVATILAFLQTGLLLFLSFFIKYKSLNSSSRAQRIPLLGNCLGLFFLLVFLSCYFGTLIAFSWTGWHQQSAFLWVLLQDSKWIVGQTIFVGLLSGFLVYLFLMLASVALFKVWLRTLLLGLVAPSVALLGLLFTFLQVDSLFLQLLIFSGAFCAFVSCGLYRMALDQQLQHLQGQVESALILGANKLQILSQVIWPQTHHLAARLAGIASLWVVGDFALPKVFFSNDILLGQIAEGLMNSYRLDSAMAIMDVILVIGVALYFLFRGFADVRRTQFT